MSVEEGCWEIMKRRFTRKWAASAGKKQDDCDRRKKRANENYVEYAIAKITMIREAYAGATDDSTILKVKRGLDTEGLRHCREQNDLDALLNELKVLDEIKEIETGNKAAMYGSGRQYGTNRYENADGSKYNTANQGQKPQYPQNRQNNSQAGPSNADRKSVV